jgi:hypothetical protein
MLCVALDGSGNLIKATNTDVIGVIWTPEGRKDPGDGTTAFKDIIGGKKYTVFCGVCEFVEAEVGTSPALAVGDLLYSTALGDVVTTGVAGDHYVGAMIADQAGTPGGSRLVIDIGRLPVA